jgi:hypothetical protein
VVDPDGHRPGEVRVGADQVRLDALDAEVLFGERTEAVAAHLADERRRHPAAGGPDGGVGRAPAGGELHLAERVAAGEQRGVGADQHVPGVIAHHRQRSAPVRIEACPRAGVYGIVR